MKRIPLIGACLAIGTWFMLVGGISAGDAVGEAVTLRVDEGPGHGVEVLARGSVLLQSPASGLWSVATAWKDGWPDAWHHAHPEKVDKAGQWTIVSGHLDLAQGRLDLRDAYQSRGSLIHCLRRFTWRGDKPLPVCTLSVRWMIPGAVHVKPLLPGIIYYGNPMGGRTPEAIADFTVAVHRGNPGEESIFEEHRYPVPMAVAEWQDGAIWRSAALHAIPSRVPGGHQPDQWWSLGVVSHEGETELVQLSGPCAANGRRSVVKTFAHGALDYPETWMEFKPGDVVEKTFYLQACPVVEQGSGFRQPVQAALALHAPFSLDGLPTFEQILRDKYRFACSRFRERPNDPGFEMYPDADPNRPRYVMGWCGQAEAAGPSLLVLAKRLGDPKALDMAKRSLDFLATAPFDGAGFQVAYDAGTGQWSGQDPVSMGQAMESFARAIRTARTMGGCDIKRWEAFLKKACEVQSTRILADQWRPQSTAEAYFVSPLCRAYELFGDEKFKRAALKAAEHYANRHLAMVEPYWGGSRDASCEDKEAVQVALQAFVAAYEMTKDPRHLAWASHALDALLTWTIMWDIPMPPSRLGDHAIKLHGWTTVSAQHHHADCYAIAVTPEVWRMGEYLRRNDLKRLAAVMFRSEGQLMDPSGSQGEQINYTNWSATGEKNFFRLRGSYSEGYSPFWITAHFLTAAAEFERMGVDLDRPTIGAD